MVYNPQEVDPAHQDGGPIATQLDMKTLMPVFISQLRALLGVPEWVCLMCLLLYTPYVPV